MFSFDDYYISYGYIIIAYYLILFTMYIALSLFSFSFRYYYSDVLRV